MTLFWTVSLSSEATSDYDSLDNSIASLVDAALKKLTANPEMRGTRFVATCRVFEA
jgi:mRNA-degrading endonuclease RelE of RelBE toxin-antitoxin system